MRQSMTGFASGQGEALGLSWGWDLRSVNARGLDVKLRVPDWIEGLEQDLRKRLMARIERGTVTLSLRTQGLAQEQSLELNTAQMTRVIAALEQVEEAAMARGLSLTASSGADLLALRGMMDVPQSGIDPNAIKSILINDFSPVLDAFIAARQSEGTALVAVLTRQIDEVADLIAQARAEARQRQSEQPQKLRAALARVMDAQDQIDDARIAQELALIAVKSDITEELDRLDAHVDAARALLVAPGAVGRKLDFLMQEFNREANTLCSKSQSAALTKLGLALKTVIDQMREQVQNME